MVLDIAVLTRISRTYVSVSQVILTMLYHSMYATLSCVTAQMHGTDLYVHTTIIPCIIHMFPVGAGAKYHIYINDSWCMTYWNITPLNECLVLMSQCSLSVCSVRMSQCYLYVLLEYCIIIMTLAACCRLL